MVAVVALGLLAGCGGSGGDAKKAETDGATRTDANGSPGRLTDAAIGYSVLMPRGWTYPPDLQQGQPVPLGGGGQGCAIGQAGVLGDVRGRRLLVFARRTAEKRAAKGATVSVESVEGQNVRGALVRISKSGQEARSAIFASAGAGVAITCRAAGAQAADQARGLSLLLSSVNLRSERSLERAQAVAVGVPGVQAAAVRREGSRVAVQVRVARLDGVAVRIRDVIAAVAPVVPRTDIAVNAATAAAPEKLALGRYLGGTKAGTVQVPGGQPRRFALR
jgi:hypothetical protein